MVAYQARAQVMVRVLDGLPIVVPWMLDRHQERKMSVLWWYFINLKKNVIFYLNCPSVWRAMGTLPICCHLKTIINRIPCSFYCFYWLILFQVPCMDPITATWSYQLKLGGVNLTGKRAWYSRDVLMQKRFRSSNKKGNQNCRQHEEVKMIFQI